MNKIACLVALVVSFGIIVAGSQPQNKEPKKTNTEKSKKNPVMVMQTNYGTMEIELLFNAAPNTAQNFLDLVRKKFYDSLTFHRIVPGFVIQGGDPKGDGTGGPGYSIKDEKSSQPQVRGTLGMAKSGPNTAGSQFYINLKDNTRLDKLGFTGFAKVIKGMKVAGKISKVPTVGERPKERVWIIRAYLKDTPEESKAKEK